MFSVAQKRHIAEQVQRILRETAHPELPAGEITFTLSVEGAQRWSWADIKNNGAVPTPDVNPWNEAQDPRGKGVILHRCECGYSETGGRAYMIPRDRSAVAVLGGLPPEVTIKRRTPHA